MKKKNKILNIVSGVATYMQTRVSDKVLKEHKKIADENKRKFYEQWEKKYGEERGGGWGIDDD